MLMEGSIPGFGRRILALAYEFLLLLGVWFIAAFLFHLVFRDTSAEYFRPLFQFYLLCIGGIYFIWFWTHGGQTLAMQTWKLRLVSENGGKVTMQQAMVRYLMAVIGISFLGFGLLWALFNRDRQFLHDKLAGTRIIRLS
ncbi:RDD domain containing protein [Nitrosomonas eutropha C91]|uniref:RDD domain containing protein n=2 Tax=Nitrosomonas eutropha TaxID=916 RepID=Q0AIG5_NITEC|nr:RDD domain containing protein [Nitrosomonas eutropha C91]